MNNEQALKKLQESIRGLGDITISKEDYKSLQNLEEMFPFFVVDKWLLFVTSKIVFNNTVYIAKVFSSYFEVAEKYLNIETQEMTVKLKIYNGRDMTTISLPRSVFSKNSCKELLGYGVSFLETDSKYMFKYFFKSELNAQTTYTYSKLGWDTLEGNRIFKSSKILPSAVKGYEYNGILDLKPYGDESVWLNMVRNEVLGNTPLTMVWLLGFSSFLLGLLNSKFDLGSIVFSLANSSSKGKTTSAMLAVSVFGNPMVGKSTLINYNGTLSAILDFIAACNSHTVVLDEAAIKMTDNFDKFLYTVCSGKDKSRLNSDGTPKSVRTFSSVVISTSEFNLITDDSLNGLRTRVFEISDVLTSSAENSDAIKRTISENYGFACEGFIKLLTDKGDSVYSDYSDCKVQLLESTDSKAELTERIISKLAVVLLTAKYVEELYRLDIGIDKLVEYLKGIECNISTSRAPEDIALDYILQDVCTNGNKYISNDSDAKYLSSAVGKISTTPDYIEYAILKTEVIKIFERNHVINHTDIINRLKDKGILIYERGRKTNRVFLVKGQAKQTCYVFRIPRQDSESDAEENDLDLHCVEPNIDEQLTIGDDFELCLS